MKDVVQMQFVGEEIVSTHHCYFCLSSSGWLCLNMGYSSVSPVQYSIRFLSCNIDQLPLDEKFENHHPQTCLQLQLRSKMSIMTYYIWRASNVRTLRLLSSLLCWHFNKLKRRAKPVKCVSILACRQILFHHWRPEQHGYINVLCFRR